MLPTNPSCVRFFPVIFGFFPRLWEIPRVSLDEICEIINYSTTENYFPMFTRFKVARLMFQEKKIEILPVGSFLFR